jgi:hypothetical protein
MASKKSYRPFTFAEDQQVMYLRGQGLTFEALAMQLGRSYESCRSRYNTLIHQLNNQLTNEASEGEAKPKPQQRPCMCCRQTFWSTGPGNRLCVDCKRRDADEPYQLVLR